MIKKSLPPFMVNDIVQLALREDLGRAGDITSQSLIPDDRMWRAKIVAREDCIVAGIDFAKSTFKLLNSDVEFKKSVSDGDVAIKGDVLANISGRAVSMLEAERTALNFMSHLSGIATLTNSYVKEIEPYEAKICCTRKTTPNLRIAEKYAVKVGGGVNHRFGLDDAVLIKDNHIAVVGGIKEAVILAKKSVGHMVKIEVEVDSIDQLKEIMDMDIDAVLLDNMSPVVLAQAVQLIAGKFIAEASGGVTFEALKSVAKTGVDIISVGALTKHFSKIDFALDEA